MESPDELDVINLEDYAHHGKHVPHGRRYRVRIDGHDVVLAERISRAVASKLAGKRECTYEVVEEFRDRAICVVGAREEVDLRRVE